MDCEIKYLKRKNVSITVKNGRLIIKAPIGTSRSTIEKIVHKHYEWIQNRMKRDEEKRRLESSLTDEDIKKLKKRAKEILTEKTAYYAAIMGLSYAKVKINSAKTRFGSCSSNGNINYSYRLILYPERAIDYVVVHELAHLREMNHSDNFYKVVAEVLPDYKARRELLKAIPK